MKIIKWINFLLKFTKFFSFFFSFLIKFQLKLLHRIEINNIFKIFNIMCYPEYLKIVQSINILLKYIQSKWRQGCFNMLIIY